MESADSGGTLGPRGEPVNFEVFRGDWRAVGELQPLTITKMWLIEDRSAPGRTDGWFVVRPGGGECGPFTEDEASRMLPILQQRYPDTEPRS